MKKIFYLLIVLGGTLTLNVNAEEYFYKNKNGILLNENEYKFFKDFYTENYIDYITEDIYNDFLNNGFFDKKVFSTEYNGSNLLTRGAVHETNSKLIRMSKVCSSHCKISIVAKWKKSPVVRSYDLIGVYLEGGNFENISYAKLFSDGTCVENTETKKTDNALSTTIKLPTKGNSLEIIQSFDVKKSRIIYSSYQHAKKSISLANSRKFSFSKYGYGNVYLFDESVRSYYDAMQGVSISLN